MADAGTELAVDEGALACVDELLPADPPLTGAELGEAGTVVTVVLAGTAALAGEALAAGAGVVAPVAVEAAGAPDEAAGGGEAAPAAASALVDAVDAALGCDPDAP